MRTFFMSEAATASARLKSDLTRAFRDLEELSCKVCIAQAYRESKRLPPSEFASGTPGLRG